MVVGICEMSGTEGEGMMRGRVKGIRLSEDYKLVRPRGISGALGNAVKIRMLRSMLTL